MGDNNLRTPNIEKRSLLYETPYVRVGACGMQGWRKRMEDAHLAQINLGGVPDEGLYGVYDGHNGQKVAKYTAQNLSRVLMSVPQAAAGDFDGAFKNAYMQIDEALSKDFELRDEGGCTAVTVLLKSGKIFCANAGDSRAVLARSNQPAIPLSTDHKPSVPEEIARVERAGGTISGNRVNGMLSLTRAIGDFDLKGNPDLPLAEQAITAFPDVLTLDQHPDDEFIVIACDGIWDVMTNDDCCNYVRQQLAEKTTDGEAKHDIALICENVCDHCLAPAANTPGSDNMTIIVVQFKDEWKKKFAA